MLARQCYCFGPRSGLPNDSHVRLPVDDAEETQANYRVIIGDKHSNHAGIESFPAAGRTKRIERGRLHDCRLWRLGFVKELYTKRPGIATCRFDGTICDPL